MKHASRSSSWAILPITLIGTLSVSAEPWFWQPPTEQPLNRFGASFRAAFDVDVEFKNLGAFAATPGRLTPDGAAYNYDDGYVLVDSTGNMGGFTRYWGYDSASQLPGDGTLVMSSYSSAGATARDDDEFCPGAEITYNRILGGDNDWRWGLEAALNYMDVSVRDSSSVSAPVARQSDAYPLPPLEGGGYVNPPPAPYQGRYDLQPEGNPVIGATPLSSSASTVMADVSGSRRFDADVFGLRFGPFLEVPLGMDFFLTIGGGLSVAQVQSDFEFSDAVAIVNGITATGSGSHQDWQAGWYAAANVTYRLSKTWELFGGAQYQDVGKYSHTENGRKAVLDLSQSIFGVVGLNVSF
jgi:hypothetical protein